MNVFHCVCGARYKIPAGAEGRMVRCKQCGRIDQLPALADGPIPLAGDSHFGAEAFAATASASMFDMVMPSPALEEDPIPLGTPRVYERIPTGFWEDVGWSFLFLISPHNLVMLSVVWALLVVQWAVGWVPLAGIGAASLIGLFITAWYMSIISETAGGDDELPNFAISGGWWDDVVVPALRYAGTWVILLAPAVVYALFIARTLQSLLPLMESGADPYTLLKSGGGATIPLVALVFVALFLWPVALMCTAMGGLGSLIRLDLIVVSVVNTFLPYTAIVLMVFAASLLPGFILQAAAGIGVVGVIAAAGVEVYFSIIAMKLIGLYYRHFKHELAWDWE